jgi:hypothetical protein
VKEDHVVELLEMLGVSRSNADARSWLAEALIALPSVVRAKSGARPQAERNKDLTRLARSISSLRRLYCTLDPATKAALYLAGRGAADLLEEIVVQTLKDWERAAAAAKQPTKPGAPVRASIDEGVKLLVGFVVRFGACKPSAKPESKFERFARRAFELVNGHDQRSDCSQSVRRSIARVLKTDSFKRRQGTRN